MARNEEISELSMSTPAVRRGNLVASIAERYKQALGSA